MLRLAPPFAIAVLAGPVLFGLAATILPAFGYFPALGGESLGLETFRQWMRTPGLMQSSRIALMSGLLTPLAALLIVAGFLAAWSHSRAFATLQHFLSPLLAVPHAAAAFGLAFLIAPSGWLMRLASPQWSGFERPPDWLIVNDPLGLAMMGGLLAKEIPFLFLVSLAAMPQARPRRYAQAATALGYGRIAAFLHGVWPNLYPQIRLPVFAVIAYASSTVDVALILGPTNPPTLAARLLAYMNEPDLSWKFRASAGALMQLGVAMLAIAIWIAGERVAGWLARALRAGGRRFARDAVARFAAAAAAMIPALAIFAGLLLLALWSLASFWTFPDAFPEALTLRNWRLHLAGAAGPLATTVLLGIASTALAVALVLACLQAEARFGVRPGKAGQLILYLPLLIPQVSFAFGLQLFLLLAGMDGKFAALALIHLVFVLPYAFLSLSDPWRAWDRRYERAALSMGASHARILWRIRLPMLMRPILVACAVGFAISVDLYLPTLLAGAGRWPTITTEAVALASGGDRRIIGIYAFLQMLLPLGGFAAALLIPSLLFLRRAGMRPGA